MAMPVEKKIMRKSNDPLQTTFKGGFRSPLKVKFYYPYGGIVKEYFLELLPRNEFINFGIYYGQLKKN